jgi:hypothetical protein
MGGWEDGRIGDLKRGGMEGKIMPGYLLCLAFFHSIFFSLLFSASWSWGLFLFDGLGLDVPR